MDGILNFFSQNKGGFIGLAIGAIATMLSGGEGLLALLLPVIGLAAGSVMADKNGVLHGLWNSINPPPPQPREADKNTPWTEAYVRQNVMASDQDMAAFIEKNGAQTAERSMGATEKGQKTMQEFEKLAHKMGVIPTPQLFVINTPESTDNAFATATSSGKTYIFIGKELYDALDSKHAAVILGHELAHIKHHDMLADGIVKSHNQYHDSPQYKRREEQLADLGEVQATGDPATFSQAMLTLDKLSDHPSINARIHFIEENFPSAHPVKPAQTPPKPKAIKDHKPSNHGSR